MHVIGIFYSDNQPIPIAACIEHEAASHLIGSLHRYDGRQCNDSHCILHRQPPPLVQPTGGDPDDTLIASWIAGREITCIIDYINRDSP